MIIDLIKKIKQYFSVVTFVEEGHKYYYQNESPLSVSKLIEHYIDKPDFDLIAQRIAIRDNKTVEEVKQPWIDKTKYACDRGHEIHEFAEQLVSIEQKRLEDEAISKFWEDLSERYVVLVLELPMIHKYYIYCGTPDVILYDLWTDTIVIVDYKSNEDLFKNFRGQRLKEPFFFLEDCPFNKYQIQLCYYQLLVEQLNLEVSERWIVHVKDTNYKIFKTDDFTIELKQELKCNVVTNNKRIHNRS